LGFSNFGRNSVIFIHCLYLVTGVSVNGDVSPRNLWLISFSKIWSLLNLVKPKSKKFLNSKASKSVLISTLIFSGCRVIINFVIFHKIKVAKHICDPYRHLSTESCSKIILIGI
jgi:hypothetical protein